MVLLCALCLAGLISGKIFLSHNENHQEKQKKRSPMTMPLKVMTIFGTRPEAVKMALW